MSLYKWSLPAPQTDTVFTDCERVSVVSALCWTTCGVKMTLNTWLTGLCCHRLLQISELTDNRQGQMCDSWTEMKNTRSLIRSSPSNWVCGCSYLHKASECNWSSVVWLFHSDIKTALINILINQMFDSCSVCLWVELSSDCCRCLQMLTACVYLALSSWRTH